MSPHASIVRQRQLSRWRVSPLLPARTSENECVAPFGVALPERFSFLALCALIRVPVCGSPPCGCGSSGQLQLWYCVAQGLSPLLRTYTAPAVECWLLLNRNLVASSLPTGDVAK